MEQMCAIRTQGIKFRRQDVGGRGGASWRGSGPGKTCFFVFTDSELTLILQHKLEIMNLQV